MADKSRKKHRLSKIFKRAMALFIIVMINFNSYAAVVSSNDGSAFITKAEFDALVNDFNSRIEDYEKSIDAKIDGAIAEYLAGLATTIAVSGNTLFSSIVGDNNITSRVGSTDLPFVKGNIGVNYTFTMNASDVDDPREGGKMFMGRLRANPTATSRRYVEQVGSNYYWAGYATDVIAYVTATHIVITNLFVFGEDDDWSMICPYGGNTNTSNPGSTVQTNILQTARITEAAGTVGPNDSTYAYREEKTLRNLYDYFYSGDQNTYYWIPDITRITTYTPNIAVTNSWRSFFDRATFSLVRGYVWARTSTAFTNTTRTPAKYLSNLNKYTGTSQYDSYMNNRGVFEPNFSLSGQVLSSIYYPDYNTYRYTSSTNGGETITNKTLSRYNMYAGVPLFTVLSGYEYEWPVKFTDSQSVDLYIKYEPFGTGVTESQCIEVSVNGGAKSKKATIPSGGATVTFKAPESGLLFVKWKLSSSANGGGTLDTENSTVYIAYSEA